MARYWVTANAADGFNGRHRGYPAVETGDKAKDYPRGFGWFWPKSGIEVEVLNQEEDPKHQPQGEGAVRTIGQRTFRAIKTDGHIFAGPVDGGEVSGPELVAARARIAELEAALAAKGGGETGKAKAKDHK